MPLVPLRITDFKGGLQKDKDPSILVNDAFPVMENMYNWRGKLRRRDGFTLLGRMRRELTAAVTGTINMSSTPTATYNIFTALGVAASEPNAAVELGSITNISVTIQGSVSNAVLDITTDTENFTITAAGTPNVTAATLDYATGDISVTHTVNDLAAANVTLTLAYYPSLPCMGLFTRDITGINAEDTIAFDTKYSYIYNNTTNDFQEWIAGTTWSGTNSNFFMATNYWRDGGNNRLFWVVNFSGSAGDPLRYSNGIVWTTFTPVISGATLLTQCRFLVPYKGRLLAFHPYEGATLGTSNNFPQRLRYSQNGSPIDSANGWRDDIAGRGGFIDAPTSERILGFAFLRDQLLVGFERSIWAVRYTGNEILPFVWEKINSEFGWESMRSLVQFDQGVIGVGPKSISVCDGVNVTRLDEEIPDEVFKFHNDNDGVNRVAGIRDFNNELAYWCFANDSQNGTFPNRLLVYNYRNSTWSTFKDSFTALGNWQRSTDIRWSDLTDVTWEQNNNTWNSASLQSRFPNIIAGNQQGYVFVLNQRVSNAPSLYISGITTGTPPRLNVINHNLESGDVVKITGILGTASTLNNVITEVDVIDSDNIDLIGQTLAGGSTYFGGGQLEKFSNFSVRSKKFNVMENGKSIRMAYIDFHAAKTDDGEFTCNIYSDYDNTQPINDGSDGFYNTVVETSGTSDEIEANDRTLYRFYCNNFAQFSQFELTFSDLQMLDESINHSQILIDMLILWMNQGGRSAR